MMLIFVALVGITVGLVVFSRVTGTALEPSDLSVLSNRQLGFLHRYWVFLFRVRAYLGCPRATVEDARTRMVRLKAELRRRT